MNLIINPTKLLYWENDTKNLRLGNFPETGKIVEFEDSEILEFFKKFNNGLSFDQAEEYLINNFNITNQEAEESLQYLISQNILVDKNIYDKMISDNQFSRQLLYFYMLSDTNCVDAFEKIKDKRILVLGLGGIGCIVAELLVRAGFNNLIIVDHDCVEESNLIRQLSYDKTSVGKKKIDSLEIRLKNINDKISITKVDMFIDTVDKIKKYVEVSDFVVNTLDKPLRQIRKLINNVCIECKKPVIFAGFAEHVGMVGPFIVPNKTACLNCIETIHDEPVNIIQNVPSYGPLCNTIASIVCDEIINYFVKFKKRTLQGKTLMFNMYNYSTSVKRWKRKHDCIICGGVNEG